MKTDGFKKSVFQFLSNCTIINPLIENQSILKMTITYRHGISILELLI